jgi:GTP cyclohydrolase I
MSLHRIASVDGLSEVAAIDDVQGREDQRGIPLDEVGVSDLSYPIVVCDRANQSQQTIARLSMSVSLPQQFKGTHMSRFVEVIEEHRGEITMRTMPSLLELLRQRLNAEAARVEAVFPYFLHREAPVTKARALMDYQCTFCGSSDSRGPDFVLGVRVPVTSLCPCSKEISDYGAHNQRGYLTLEVRSLQDSLGEPRWIWIEELVELAESCASSPVYPLLKRPDERYVTMQAYDKPVFVEDMVRNVAEILMRDARVAWFRVSARNDESIHNHSAFAATTWSRHQRG